jgi:hypothetical protein
MSKSHKLFWKCSITFCRDVPRNACWFVGSDAMPFSVALLTVPKPTAMMVIPSALSVLAVWIAPAEPPYPAFCSPSLRTTTTRW